jgi:hypothetical protein
MNPPRQSARAVRRSSFFLTRASFAPPLLALAFVAGCGGSQFGGGQGAGGDAGSGPGEGGSVYTEPDGESCVNIDVATYDHTCEQDSDCISITPGTICSGECICNVGAAVNQSEEARYQAAVSQLASSSSLCPCPVAPSPVCHNHQCTLCSEPGACEGGGSTDAGCAGDSSCGTQPSGPGSGFVGPKGKLIQWGSPCDGDVYYPDGPGWAICVDGVWQFTTDPSAISGYTEYTG